MTGGVAFVGQLGSAVVAASGTAYTVGLFLDLLERAQSRNGLLMAVGACIPASWMQEEDLANDIMRDCFLKKGSISLAAEKKRAADGWLNEFLQSMPEKSDKLNAPYLEENEDWDQDPGVDLKPEDALGDVHAAAPQAAAPQAAAPQAAACQAAAPQAGFAQAAPAQRRLLAAPLSAAASESKQGKPKQFVERRRAESAGDATIRNELRDQNYSKSHISQLVPGAVLVREPELERELELEPEPEPEPELEPERVCVCVCVCVCVSTSCILGHAS